MLTSLLVAAAVVGADQDAFVADWWASQIGSHFVEEISVGGVQVGEGYLFGFIQGAIELSDQGLSRVTIPVRSELLPTEAFEFVVVRINGEEIGIVDDIDGAQADLTAVVRGPVMYYHFEFGSALESPGSSLMVLNGTVEPLCAADINGDSRIDVLDLVAYRQAFMDGDAVADCNADGELNVLDYLCFRRSYAQPCR